MTLTFETAISDEKLSRVIELGGSLTGGATEALAFAHNLQFSGFGMARHLKPETSITLNRGQSDHFGLGHREQVFEFGMSTLFMIRHGQASFGKANYDRLSSKGKQQARIVADHLCRLATCFDAVYTGTLNRQQQTAQAMAAVYDAGQRSMPAPRALPELDEYDAGRLWCHMRAEILAAHPELAANPEQLHRDPKAFQRIFSRIVHHWVAGEHTPDHLESWTTFRSRVTCGLRHIMQKQGSGKRVAVFTSAGPVAVAVQIATAMPDVHCTDLSWQILNASITRFHYHKDRFTLAGLNDVAALEMAGGNGLLTYR